MARERRNRFTVHLSARAWAQAGTMPSAAFNEVLQVVQQVALSADRTRTPDGDPKQSLTVAVGVYDALVELDWPARSLLVLAIRAPRAQKPSISP